MIAVAIAVCFFLLASSSLTFLEPYSIVLRVMGALIVMLPVLWRKRLSERASIPRFSRALAFVGLGFGVYLTSSTIAHDRLSEFGVGLTSFFLVACLCYVLMHYYSPSQISKGVYAAFVVVCASSLVAYRFIPDIAIENFRLRGVLENANGLGFVAFALGAVSLAVCRGVWQSLLGIGLALSCLFLTGSRASMLAFVVVGVGLAIGRVRRARVFCALAAAAVGILGIVEPQVLSDAVLFRTTDTRSFGFDMMQFAMGESFWTGLGELPSDTMVAGSPFAAGITGGMVGLIGLGIMYVGLLRNFALVRPRTLALIVAGVLHSVFESWMLSFSAPMLLAFFVMLVGFTKWDAAEKVAVAAAPVSQTIFPSGQSDVGPLR